MRMDRHVIPEVRGQEACAFRVTCGGWAEHPGGLAGDDWDPRVAEGPSLVLLEGQALGSPASTRIKVETALGSSLSSH